VGVKSRCVGVNREWSGEVLSKGEREWSEREWRQVKGSVSGRKGE
jgi:hypothetical protein